MLVRARQWLSAGVRSRACVCLAMSLRTARTYCDVGLAPMGDW